MNNEHDEEIQSLIEELERLQLRIGTVNNRLRNLEQKRNNGSSNSEISSNETQHRSRRSKREKETGPSKKPASRTKGKHCFEIRDRIRVKNPTKNQPVDTGRVTGYTRNGYIRFDLDDGTSTCRASKNLELIEKAT